MTALGDRVLDWMLRRLGQGAPLHHDLVLVHQDQPLSDVSAALEHNGQPWRIHRVGGELSLRDVLSDAARMIALVPQTFAPPPDIAGRAYLGRVLDVRPEDIIAALAGRFCERIDDPDLISALRESLDLLRDSTGQWTLGPVVTAKEVRSAIVSTLLKTQVRLDRESDRTILARWITDAPPSVRAASLLKQALLDAHGPTGAWLAWVAETGSLRQLITAGALVGSEQGRTLAPAVPGVAGVADVLRLRNLVEYAVREAHGAREANAAARVRTTLADAEQLAARLDIGAIDPARHPLLQTVLRRALIRHAERARDGDPTDDTQIETLQANLYADEATDAIELVRLLSRLARFVARVAPLAEDQPMDAWFYLARNDAAWADFAIRRVRQLAGAVELPMAEIAVTIVARSLARRDELNAAFAAALSHNWQAVAASKSLRKPVPLHNVTRSVVRRLIEAGRRVFLVVLDGCDLSTFIELTQSLPKDIGLLRPVVRDAALGDDFLKIDPFHVAIAALPTVTSHSRRALFAGEIPGNTVLDDTEKSSANASADKTAWKRNAALGDIVRILFLKGDLQKSAAPLLNSLTGNDRPLVAAVFNDVDDALASQETTALGPWTVQSLGLGFLNAIKVAIENDRVVIVTSDHGHTPFIDVARHVADKGLGNRYAETAIGGTVRFDQGPLPRKPLYLQTRVGAWQTRQRRGFHGGASLEEVVIPLAFLGKVFEGQGRPAPPSWWWSRADQQAAPETPVLQSPNGPQPRLPGAASPPSTATPPPAAAPKPAVTPPSAARPTATPPPATTSKPITQPPAAAPKPAAAPPSAATPKPAASPAARVPTGSATPARTATPAPVSAPAPLPTEPRAPAPVEPPPPATPTPAPGQEWLLAFENPGVRDLFAHLAHHGIVTEDEAARMLGGPRALRSFSRELEVHVKKAPFAVRIDNVGGVKRYVREGQKS